jgi:hypothetical protein
VFAAPTQHNSVASLKPSYSADALPATVTGPPSWIPEAQEGSGIRGIENNTCSPALVSPPRMERNTTRMAITVNPNTR